MTNKAIFTVEVDDSALSEFSKKLDEVKNAAADAGVWGELNKQIKEANENIKELLDAINHLRPPQPQEKDDTWKLWAVASNAGKFFYEHIKSATRDLMRWTGLTAVFGSIISAGGLFGITRMAMGVSDIRSSASGLGVGYGAYQSFGASFGRLGNADRILAGYQNAMTDVTQRGPLQALLGPGGWNRIKDKDPAGAFVESLPDLARTLQRIPRGNMKNTLDATGLSQLGIDVNTAQLIMEMARTGELQDIVDRYKKNKSALDLPEKMQRGYRDLNDQLERAKQTISTKFERALSLLAKPLGNLADVFAKVVKVVMSRPEISDFMEKVAKGLDWIADQISASNVDKWVRDAKDALSNLKNLIGKVNINGEDPAASLFGGRPENPTYQKWNRQINYWLHGHKDNASLGDAASRGRTGGERMDTGKVHQGLRDMEDQTQGYGARLTAGNDTYHQRFGTGQHPRGLAFDSSLGRNAPLEKVDAYIEYLRKEMQAAGMDPKDYKILDEYRGGSAHKTGPHVHFQFNSPEAAERYHRYREGNPQLKSRNQEQTTVHHDGSIQVESTRKPYGAMPSYDWLPMPVLQ